MVKAGLIDKPKIHDGDKMMFQYPSPTGVALKKLAESMVYLYIVVFYVGTYVPELIAKEEYLALPFWQWALWWFFTIFLIRVNYYFAWTFGIVSVVTLL